MLVHGTPLAPSVLLGVPFDNDAFQREVLEERATVLEEVARDCAAGEVSRRAEFGSAIEVLVRVLEDEDADFLVVGTRGRGAMRSVLLGSTAHEMLAVSRCPVVVVSPHTAS